MCRFETNGTVSLHWWWFQLLCISDSMCPCCSFLFTYLFNGLSALDTKNTCASRPLCKTQNIHWILIFLHMHIFFSLLITNDSYPPWLIMSEPWMRSTDIQWKSVNHSSRLNIYTGKQTKWSQKIIPPNFMGLALSCPPFHKQSDDFWLVRQITAERVFYQLSLSSNCVCG